MWSDRVDDNANKLAQKIIQRLLSKDSIYNSDEQGVLVNELSSAMYQGASIDILFEMFDYANRIDDYLSLSFVIEESKMRKSKELFSLTKKLIDIGYLRIVYGLLPYYSINAETKDELYLLQTYLSNRNVIICAYAMKCISYLLNDQQIIVLSQVLSKKLNISNIFLKKDFVEYMDIIKNGKTNEKLLAFCSAARNDLSLNELLTLAREASCEEIYEFFYFHVLDKKEYLTPCAT